MQTSDDRLNPHDALILTYARRYAIPLIATFDADLDVRGVRAWSTRPTSVPRSALVPTADDAIMAA